MNRFPGSGKESNDIFIIRIFYNKKKVFVNNRAVSTEHVRRQNTIELSEQQYRPLYWINDGENSSRGSRINEIDRNIDNIATTSIELPKKKQ